MTDLRRILRAHRVTLPMGGFTVRALLMLDEPSFERDLADLQEVGDELVGAVAIMLTLTQLQPVAMIVMDDEHLDNASVESVILTIAEKLDRTAVINDGPPPLPEYVHIRMNVTGRTPGERDEQIQGLLDFIFGHRRRGGQR